jgi:hypothetical protein
MKYPETPESSSAGLVLSALRLVGSPHGISLGGLVHLLPFLTGTRSACRLVLGSGAARKFAAEVRATGREALLTSLSRRERGPDWFEFARSDASSDYQLLVVATDSVVAEELVHAEFDGRFRDSGSLLEYPPCCVDAYGKLSGDLEYWPSYYLRQSNVVSPWCNRLVYLWGKCCPTGELFPCSLNCSHAVALGKKNMDVLSALGLERLRQEICARAAEPLSVNAAGLVYRGMPIIPSDQEIVMELI